MSLQSTDSIKNQFKPFSRRCFHGFFGIGFTAELLSKPYACKIALIGLVTETGIAVFPQYRKKLAERFLRIALSLVCLRNPDAEVRSIAPKSVGFDAANKMACVIDEQSYTAESDLFTLIAAMEIVGGIANVCEWFGELILRDVLGKSSLIGA